MGKLKLIIITIAIIIIAFFVVLFIANFIYPPIKQKIDIAKLPNDYYKNLAQKCKTTGSYGCCLASINDMAAKGYELEPKDGCPKGYQRNMLKCVDSFKWCEPIIIK